MQSSLLKRLRGALGLTQTQLGDILGYSRVYISEVERNRRIPSKAFLNALGRLNLIREGSHT